MKLGGREIALDDSAPFFGKESVAQHVQLSAFYADAGGCPAQRARAYGTVKNISRMKLRGLKALVLIGSLKSGDYNGQVQSMDPSDLVPGEESEIFLWLSCDWAGKSSSFRTRNDSVLVAHRRRRGAHRGGRAARRLEPVRDAGPREDRRARPAPRRRRRHTAALR